MKGMRMILAVFACAASLLVVAPARAATPITVESDWTWDLFYTSHTGVTSATDDIAGLNGIGVSTTGLNIIGFAYSFNSVGGNAQFTISYPTRTYAAGAVSPSGFNNPSPSGWGTAPPSISTTSVAAVIAGYPVNGNFETMTMNPVLTWSGLSTAATVYVYVEIGRQKFR